MTMSDLVGPFTRVDHGDYWDTTHAVYAAASISSPLESLAQLLAEPLRRAYLAHIHPADDDPERAVESRWPTMRRCCVAGGIANCAEAQFLDRLRPWGDRVMFPPMGGAS